MTTLICYVSPPSKLQVQTPFITNDSELGPMTFRGRQTNEAPTCYAIAKLHHRGNHLDRIIALKTSKSDYYTYKQAIEYYCSTNKITIPEFCPICTETDESSSDMLKNVLDKLQQNEKIILETTGGPRTAVTMLTLLSRFLHEKGSKVEFSTYAEYDENDDYNRTGTVVVTQTDQLFDLLEATSMFASTGNTKSLKDVCEKLNIPERPQFFTASREFFTAMLVCNTSVIEDKIEAFEKAVETIKNADYSTETVNAVIFKHMLIGIIEKKMTFLGADDKVLELMVWCNENGYLQQAVTILNECIRAKGDGKYVGRYQVDKVEKNVIICLRNSINHATGEAIDAENNIPSGIRNKVMGKVDKMIATPNEIKDFVCSVLKKIRDGRYR